MFSFALQVVLLVLILGGAIAYIGNYIGRYIGKRRLTLFNLRPRHTAIMITVFSGILIAVTTAAVLLLVSADARTALLGLDRLKQEISQRSAELETTRRSLSELGVKLETARKETAILERAKLKLGKEVKIAREGQVLWRAGEVISLSLIQAGPERSKLETGLRQIINAAKAQISENELESAVESILTANKLFVVKLSAARNVLRGEAIPAKIELIENQLVFPAGREIAAHDIPAGLFSNEIEDEITAALRDAHRSARDAGVIPDTAGSLGSVPYSEIFDLAKKIKLNNKKVNLKVLADGDIYAIGPLTVKFKISYK